MFRAFSHQNITGRDGGDIYDESYQYFTSKGTTIDIRAFREDAVAYVKEYGKPYESSYKSNPRWQGRTSHSGQWCINRKHYPHRNVARKMSDSEMIPFNSRKDKDRIKGWDRNNYRLCSCSWKDQKKYKKQWMHKIHAKNSKTIRKLITE